MTKYTAYFDESGDQRIKVFAGFVAANEQWERFEKEWRDVLTRFEAPPLHMRTFAHSIDEFATWKGDEQRRRGFLKALIGVILIRTRTSFATAVLVDDFEDVARRYPNIREHYTPFGMAANGSIVKVAKWAARYQIPGADVGFIFEDGASEKKLFVREAKEHLGVEITSFAKKGDYAAFQAADLLAFEYLHSNRTIAAAGPAKVAFDELRKPLQTLLAPQPESAAAQWGLHGKKTIEDAWLDERSKYKPPR
jgi:uncharacterized protein DUF3800